MKVVHLTQSVSTLGGGIAEAVRALTMALEPSVKQVTVLSVGDEGGRLDPWPDGSPVLMNGWRGPGMAIVPGMRGAIRDLKPDVVHTHGLWTWFSCVVPGFAAAHGIPYVVSPHGMLDSWALAQSAWRKRLAARAFERRHLHGAACLHALCEAEAAAMRNYGLTNPIAVIPNGVEMAAAHDDGIGERSYNKTNQVMLFLGRLHPKKGLINALRAWAKVAGKGVGRGDWRFVIAGWDQGGHEAELKQLCGELGLACADLSAKGELTDEEWDAAVSDYSVVFTGPAFGAAKEALLRRASAFVLPSFSEGLPVAVLEAWASRLPALLTDYCNLPEGFSAGAALRIGTDVDEVAAGMRALQELPAREVQEMGDRGRKLVESRFTWQRVAGQMNSLYLWLRGGGERPEFVRT